MASRHLSFIFNHPYKFVGGAVILIVAIIAWTSQLSTFDFPGLQPPVEVVTLPIPEEAVDTSETAGICTTAEAAQGVICTETPKWKAIRVKDILPQMERGQFIYNRTTEMWRDIPVTIMLKISVDTENKPTLPRALKGDHVAGSTPVAPEMAAELLGSAGLLVEPSGEVRKSISDISPVSWQWIVKPKAEDKQLLTLIVFIRLEDKGKAYTVMAYQDEITVNVTAWQATKDFVGEIQPVWLFSAGALPALWAGYLWLKTQTGQPASKLPPSRFADRMRRGRKDLSS